MKRRTSGSGIDTEKLDEVVAKARRGADQRMRGYREQSLRMHPWVCALRARVQQGKPA